MKAGRIYVFMLVALALLVPVVAHGQVATSGATKTTSLPTTFVFGGDFGYGLYFIRLKDIKASDVKVDGAPVYGGHFYYNPIPQAGVGVGLLAGKYLMKVKGVKEKFDNQMPYANFRYTILKGHVRPFISGGFDLSFVRFDKSDIKDETMLGINGGVGCIFMPISWLGIQIEGNGNYFFPRYLYSARSVFGTISVVFLF